MAYIYKLPAIFEKLHMKENWLFIKTPDHYGNPKIIQVDGNIINHFSVKKSDGKDSLEITNEKRKEILNEVEHKSINPNRVRFYRNGKIYKAFSETESTTEDCIFEDDYEKLNATETELTENEIQNLKFEFNWNGEKMKIGFNEDLDPPVIKEINQKLNRKGSRIILEKLNNTLFLSFYVDIYHDKLIPIKYVDKKKIILYGFPKEPYEVVCKVSE